MLTLCWICYSQIPCSRIILENLIPVQLTFYGTKMFITITRTWTEPYHRPAKFSQHPYTLFKVHLILSTSRYVWGHFIYDFPTKFCICFVMSISSTLISSPYLVNSKNNEALKYVIFSRFLFHFELTILYPQHIFFYSPSIYVPKILKWMTTLPELYLHCLHTSSFDFLLPLTNISTLSYFQRLHQFYPALTEVPIKYCFTANFTTVSWLPLAASFFFALALGVSSIRSVSKGSESGRI